jgi:hypothetical protein
LINVRFAPKATECCVAAKRRYDDGALVTLHAVDGDLVCARTILLPVTKHHDHGYGGELREQLP